MKMIVRVLWAALLSFGAVEATSAATLFHPNGGGAAPSPIAFACDSISGGCAAAYSVTHSLVSTYAGALFELVQQAPVWTGTGYISGTTFTVSSTTTGSLASSNIALSAAGSGTTPALKPITHIVSGSGPYTVDKSQTAGSSGSPLIMAAYKTFDVPQSNHNADLSGVPSFCENETCLYLIKFNEASTGSANDLIASNISGGATFNPNCTASIVTCAPLFWMDTSLNVAVVPDSYPTGMETCAGAIPCSTSGIPSGNVSQDIILVARPDMYTNCCGEFGKMEAVGGGNPSGSMFAIITNLFGNVFGCTTANEWCGGSDLEGASDLLNYDAGTSQRNIYELKYNGSSTLSYLINNSTIFSGAPATTPISSGVYVREGLAGDRSTAPLYFYDALMAADSGNHTAAYNNLVAWYAARSPSSNIGPLDIAFYVNQGFTGASNGYQSALIGNARVGYSARCLSKSYTGPIADLTDSEGSPVTETFGCINGVIDPGAATFCAANAPCRVSGLYVQAPWSTSGGNKSNLYDPLLKLTCSGALSTCPTMSFSGSANALNNQPTLHFSGAQCLLSSTMSGYIAHVLAPWEIGAVMRRTSGTTYGAGVEWGANSYYYLGAGNSANTAAFSNGQAFGSGTASDNTWHSLISDTTANSTGTLYVDGSSVGTASLNAGEVLQSYVTVGCGWNGSSIINALNGDIAEVWLQNRTTDAQGDVTSRVAQLYANQQSFWGTLPSGGYSGNLPDHTLVVNYSNSPATNPWVRIPQLLGDNDVPSGQTLTAAVSSMPMTFTAGELASGQSSTPISLTMLGQLPATIPGSQSISSITSSGTLATATVSGTAPATGSWVVVSGDTSHPGYDGLFQATNTGSNTFTYTMRQTQGGTPASGTLVLYNSATVALNHSSGSFNTTLPAGKTSAQVLTDLGTNFSNPGITLTNAVAAGGTFGCTGTWQMDTNSIVALGSTPAETGYDRIVTTGPSAMEDDAFAPMQDTSCTPSTISVSGNVATISLSSFNFSQMPNVTASASIAGTTLTMQSAVSNGIVAPGALVSCSGCAAGTRVVAQLSGTGNFPSTYTVAPSQTVSTQAMTFNNNLYYIKTAGWSSSPLNGVFQAVATDPQTLQYTVSGASTGTGGTLVVDDAAMYAEFNRTAFLNSISGAVQQFQFKASLNEGRRWSQNRRFAGNICVTLNGSCVRAVGGVGSSASYTVSSVDTSNHRLNIGANNLADGQPIEVCSTISMPSPLIGCNTAITSITYSAGANTRATVNVNNDFGTQFAQVLIAGATPSALNGVWPILNANSTSFQIQLSNSTSIGSGPASVPGTVTPLYYSKQGPGAPFNYIYVYNNQDEASSDPTTGNKISISSAGSGTITVSPISGVLPYSRMPLSGPTAEYDIVADDSGSLAPQPQLLVVQDMKYMRKSWRVPPYDFGVVMTNVEPATAYIYGPNSLGPCTAEINETGYHECYGSTYNEIQADRVINPWDYFGYVQTARATAEAQGLWGLNMVDNTNYRIFVTNASSYSGLNGASWSNRSNDNNNWSFGSQDFPAPDNLQTAGFDYPSLNQGDSHWYMNTIGNYELDGGESNLRQLITEANADTIQTKHPNAGFFVTNRNFTCAATGRTDYIGINGNQARSWLPEYALLGAWTAFAPDSSAAGEKSFAEQVMSDSADWQSCLANALGTPYTQSGGIDWQEVSAQCPGSGVFTNFSCASVLNTGTASTTFFQDYYAAIGAAHAYSLWPTVMTKAAIQQSASWIDMISRQWSCPQALAPYSMRPVNPTPANVPTTNVGWQSPTSVSIYYSSHDGIIFEADGQHVDNLYNGNSFAPVPVAGVDQVVPGTDTESTIGAGYSGESPSPANQYLYPQNVVAGSPRTSGTKGHDRFTLSTDSAGSSPYTWTNEMPTSTLASNINNSVTTIPLNTSISYAPQFASGTGKPIIAQVDSEFMILGTPTAAAQFTATITSGTMNVTAVASGSLAVGQQIDYQNNFLPDSLGQVPLFITALGTGSGGTGTYTVSDATRNAAAQTMFSWPLSNSFTVTTRGAYGTTAASHSSGATLTILPAFNVTMTTQNRSGANCPTNFMAGAINTPVSGTSTTVQDGYATGEQQAAGALAFTGVIPLQGFTNLWGLMNLESAAGVPFGNASFGPDNKVEWNTCDVTGMGVCP